MNVFILLLHIALVSSLTLFFLRMGKEAMIAYLALLALSANLFVHKQITLFGLNVTCSDALAVGYLLGSNLIQEFFGREVAKKTIWISFSIAATFLLLSLVQLSYLPNHFDTTHAHFAWILKPIPRITIASIFSFLAVQLLDIKFFGYLKEKFGGRFLLMRLFMSAFLAHLLDTTLFSFLALYGVVGAISHVILFGFLVKVSVVLLSTPFLSLCKKWVKREPVV